MEIRRLYPSGFCKGVINAVQLCRETRKRYPDERISVLGRIVHNDHVIRELDALGIVTLEEKGKSRLELLDQVNEGIVILTAHGTPEAVKDKIREKGLVCIDAVCTDVLKTRDLILEYLSKGYEVLYFGKEGHPEAEAILSLSEKITLIRNAGDVRSCSVSSDKILFTCQTTMSSYEAKDVKEAVLKRFPEALVETEICHATSMRQEAIMGLKDCDLLCVVGDRRSNNTRSLCEVGERTGIRKVLLISDPEEIRADDLKDCQTVCVTAGASTPPALIDAVMERLAAEAGKQLPDTDVRDAEDGLR